MSDQLPDDAKAALGKLLEGKQPLTSEEEALLEQHKDNLGIEATDQ